MEEKPRHPNTRLFLKALSRLLRTNRDKLGMSQEGLGDKAGASRSLIKNLEADKYDSSLGVDKALWLLHALRADAGSVFREVAKAFDAKEVHALPEVKVILLESNTTDEDIEIVLKLILPKQDLEDEEVGE